MRRWLDCDEVDRLYNFSSLYQGIYVSPMFPISPHATRLQPPAQDLITVWGHSAKIPVRDRSGSAPNVSYHQVKVGDDSNIEVCVSVRDLCPFWQTSSAYCAPIQPSITCASASVFQYFICILTYIFYFHFMWSFAFFFIFCMYNNIIFINYVFLIKLYV